MRVIFLDIDGVLNSSQSAAYWYRRYKNGTASRMNAFMTVCPIAYSNLQTILEKLPDLQIVLSSTWRLQPDYLDKLRDAGIEPDILSKIIDRTPQLQERGEEIRMWLNDHPVDDFVIIDDDVFDLCEFREDARFIQTSTSLGLTLYQVERVVNYFKRNDPK